jgi:hypothetical protein
VSESIEELVDAVIEILGDPDLSSDEIELKVAALALEPILARRLIDVVPEAFGLILISHIENADKMELPTTFSAQNVHGDWETFSLKDEPIFVAGVLAAQAMFHNGPRLKFQTVTNRSGLLDSVNHALNASGESGTSCLVGSRLEGPKFLGIPAETYLSE